MSSADAAGQPADEIYDEVDFVVVGSGAGGGPLAANLALAGHSVVILEAGDDHACPYYSIPIMQAYASEDADLRWDFFVRHWDDDAQQQADDKLVADRGGVLYPRGSTLGGSTAVSAMVTILPHDSDWQRLADLTGDPSWGPDAMRERWQRIEDWQGVDAEPLPGDDEATRDTKAAHGHGGWLGTTRANPEVGGREPMFLDIIGAIERTARARFGIADDISLPRDVNAADTPGDFEGMSFIPVAVRDGHRNGSRERVEDVMARHPDRLQVRLGALATRVVFEGDRAVGVEYLDQPHAYAASPLHESASPEPAAGQRRTIRARKEVILAGGAFNTPQLLMLSGVGPAEQLREHGIEVRVDAPGVGSNLHDRYEVSLVAELDRDYPIFAGSALDVPDDPEAESDDPLFTEWRDDAGGPYSTNGSLAALVTRSTAAQALSQPDSDLIIFALPIGFRGYYPGYARDAVAERNLVSVLVLKGHTTNRAGSVSLRSADPTDVPDIAFRYFGEGDGSPEQDLEGVVEGVEVARDILSRLEDAKVARELVPGADVQTREQLGEFVRAQAWGHHACGTTRIGRDDDPGAVLDGDFRVRGVDGLRVVDAGVFPDIPGFFIASAVYLVSEKASDALLAAHGIPHADGIRTNPDE
ncbi:choline dehydrogenase [Knoellia remsis]|uniref:Choline dehydrogenase n=1 Tax=Knoellia remsis TaxID=407159 RepID=A0A2T0UGN1_9MICO|nr:GMC oxidoreductase [Knoellia remsis]PRY57034.1 choline dehydrogenase [Knoellia remsis]